MSSANIIRRTVALRLASRRVAGVNSLRARSYATPAQEADPQLNGYPQLPEVQRGTLPARGWDDMLERRNLGEPVSCSWMGH
jgi:NADH dehydrogenase (ubiquinone) 1 beta subcomplex subunit 8